MNTDDQPGRRPVRSFVRRTGRVTAGQQRALAELWPRWGLERPDGPLKLDAVFGREAPRTMEIGFGDGQVLLAMARAHPEQDFLGVEVHEPGVGRALLGLEEQGLANVRLVQEDANEVLQHWLAPACLDRINLFFPDPWPKKRHHKRRIVQAAFVALAATRLKPGGLLHMATDWAPYAEHMAEVLAASREFKAVDRASDRPDTKFERRGERLGHSIADLFYCRS